MPVQREQRSRLWLGTLLFIYLAAGQAWAASGVSDTTRARLPAPERAPARHGDLLAKSVHVFPDPINQQPSRLPAGSPVTTGSTTTDSCQTILSFTLASDYSILGTSPNSATTEVYSLNLLTGHVIYYTIDTELQVTQDTLPMIGVPVLAVDLDRDGNQDLIAEYSDNLTIYSAPTWTPRGEFIFPGMNVIMYPIAVNLDGDSSLELFVTPHDLEGSSYAAILDLSLADSVYQIIGSAPAPPNTGGVAAAADFDDDGFVEFICGHGLGYVLYEWRNSTLSYIGMIGSEGKGNSSYASVVRPKPGRHPFALLGYSDPNTGVYRYELLNATSDNVFVTEHVFQDTTGFTGVHPSRGADMNCNGLDELAMFFPPYTYLWEWDPNLGVFFRSSCSWGGTMLSYYSVNLTRNGALELAGVTPSTFRVFSSSGCVGCDTTGACTPLPPCGCNCHADPYCDGVRSDIRDVVLTIEVAFRGHTPGTDPSSYCPCAPEDVDCSGAVDVVDVVKTIDVAFRGIDAESAFAKACASY